MAKHPEGLTILDESKVVLEILSKSLYSRHVINIAAA